VTADALPLPELQPSRLLRFTVTGVPQPQGSKTCLGQRGPVKHLIVESNRDTLAPWRAAVTRTAAAVHTGGVLRGPVEVRLAFRLPLPVSAPKSWATRGDWRWPAHRPDLDKLIRAVLDALTGPVLADDGQVVRLSAGKTWGDPGVTVEVWSVP
jgi:crossover junction endodeoxyribonuclease RusA